MKTILRIPVIFTLKMSKLKKNEQGTLLCSTNGSLDPYDYHV